MNKYKVTMALPNWSEQTIEANYYDINNGTLTLGIKTLTLESKMLIDSDIIRYGNYDYDVVASFAPGRWESVVKVGTVE